MTSDERAVKTTATYRTGTLAHVNLALQIQHWRASEAKRLEVGVKSYMAQIVVVVSAPKWANKSFIDHTTVDSEVGRVSWSLRVFVSRLC